MSRTPVREALLHLAALDILEHTPNKGFTLLEYTVEELQSVYEIIGVLDGKAAITSAPYLTDKDFALMQFYIDTMYAAINNHLYVKYNEIQECFHDIYINKAPNQRLINEIHRQKKFFIAKAFSKTNPELLNQVLMDTNDEHQVILNLFQENKLQELRDYIENVHWRIEMAKYDLW